MKNKYLYVLIAAIAMSLGWGIRGDYGHEKGAMIAGALVGLVIALGSGRKDWIKRAPLFGLFGAVGWAFGGQNSYGIVLGYTFSAQWQTVIYGFANVFLLGAIWGGIGAAFLAMAATYEKNRLVEYIKLFILLLAGWFVTDLMQIFIWGEVEPDILYWYDSDWIAAVTALVIILGKIIYDRKLTEASSLMLKMALGWLIGMVVLVELLDLHMTPPRSDNWAGSLGLLIGLLFHLISRKEKTVLYVSLFVFIAGGLGFSFGQLFQVLGNVSSITAFNWWKVMEESFGFIMGGGTAIVFFMLKDKIGLIENDNDKPVWMEPFAIFYLLIFIPYLNFLSNVNHLLNREFTVELISGVSIFTLYHIGFILLALTLLVAARKYLRDGLDILPASHLGKGQLLLLLIIWIFIIGDLFVAMPFGAQSLHVQGSFFVFGIILTAWVMIKTTAGENFEPSGPLKLNFKKLIITAVIIFIAAIGIQSFIAFNSHEEALHGSHNRFEINK